VFVAEVIAEKAGEPAGLLRRSHPAVATDVQAGAAVPLGALQTYSLWFVVSVKKSPGRLVATEPGAEVPKNFCATTTEPVAAVVAAIVPLPDAARLPPVPTTIAAPVFVPDVIVLNAAEPADGVLHVGPIFISGLHST
jgi:hypothetical protein